MLKTIFQLLINFNCQYICRIQPVYVVDVAAAIVSALKDDGNSMGKVYELGGPEVYTIHELVIHHILFSRYVVLG